MATFNKKDQATVKKLLDFFKNFREEHDYHYDLVNKLDKMTQDVLHSLELDNLSPNDRSKAATKLKNIRQDRRYHKDRAEALYKLVEIAPSSTDRVPLQHFINTAQNFINTQIKNDRQYRTKIKELVEL